MKYKIKLLFYNLYSLFFCLRYLPFKQAIKSPVLIHPSVKIRIDKRSEIVFPEQLWRSMFSFGFDASTGRSNCQSMLVLKNGAKLIINGLVIMSKGTRVIVDGGNMEIGHNFCCNGDCIFNCTSLIKIGEQNMYGWNTSFNTTDGHHIYVDGEERPMTGDIVIGDHVWIAANSTISKGTTVAPNCVVAQCSLVSGKYNEENCLIGGIPSKTLKRNISWSAK